MGLAYGVLATGLVLGLSGCGARSNLFDEELLEIETPTANGGSPQRMRRPDPPTSLRDAGLGTGGSAGSSSAFDAGVVFTDAGAPEFVCGEPHWEPLSTVGQPEPRGAMSAVWTGSEMLVFGGWTRIITFADGGRYDPRTNSWKPLSLAGSPPSARRLYGSAWTGSKWIIWGGNSEKPIRMIHNDGAIFDPDTNTWTRMTLQNTPRPHYGVRLEWTGSEAIWQGGFFGGSASSDGARYNPVLDRWTRIDGGPSAAAHVGLWTGSEYFLWGVPAASALYDPSTDSFADVTTTRAPPFAQNPQNAWTGDRVIVWGGYTAPAVGSGGLYDPVSDEWTPMTDVGAPSVRMGATGIWTGCEFVVWGGGGPDGSALNDGYRYDPETDRWQPLPSSDAPTARTQHVSVWTGSEIIVWGGFDDEGLGVSGGGRLVFE